MTDSERTTNKVAAVTLAFWVTKIAATTLGETAGDLFSMTLGLGYAVSSIILVGLFAIALGFQLAARSFRPFLFWSVVLLTSTAGTTLSDFMDRSLGLGYAAGSTIIAASLAAVLLAWRAVEGSLSVESITTRRAELFYWVAILFSNTLGTALGDFLADDSGLGFLGGAILVGSVIAAIAVASVLTRWNRVALFWLAFVLTRPLGATFGDFLTKPTDSGALGLGTIGSSAVLLAILIVSVEISRRREDAV
ncbi:MAG: hypothetical protein ABIR62_01225 [Dokdonella sp.]|uniref:COG4705 family protein n=1 Tax=Dokdonella sp. TaxID=2291710 RepID=UPI003264F509